MTILPQVPRVPPMVPDRGAATRRNMRPVIGTGQWSEQGEQASWLLSRGSALVCMGPELTPLTPGDDFDFRFKCLPHAQNTKRLWSVSFASDDNGASGKIKSLDGGTTYESFVVPTLFATLPSHTSRIVHFVTDNSDDDVDGNGHSEFGIKISMDATSPEETYVTSITCTELPVPYVEPDDFPGGTYKYPAQQSLRTGEPIYDDEGDQFTGPAGVQRATKAAEEDARRAVLFTCHEYPAVTETGSTFVDAFEEPIPVLARRRYSTDGAGNRTIKVWCYVIGVGQVRLTAATGDTTTLTYNTPSDYEWQVADLDIDAENLASLATDGGLRSATRDTVRVEIRCTDTVLGLRCVMGGEVD